MKTETKYAAAASQVLVPLVLVLLTLVWAPCPARAQTPTPTPTPLWVPSGTSDIINNNAGSVVVNGDMKIGGGRLKFSSSGPEGLIQGATERLSFSTTNGSAGQQAVRLRFGGNSVNSIAEFLNVNVTIGGVVPAAHAATSYSSLWLKNNVALMSEVANGYSIIKLVSNYQRTSSGWAHVDTSLPTWSLDMGSGPNWDQFSVSRAPANPAAGASYSPINMFTVNSSGNVGIGTSSPASTLHLAGPGGVSAITLNTSGAQRFRLQTLPGTPNWGGMTLNSNFTSTGWVLDDPNTNGWFFKLDGRGGNAGGVTNGLWLYRIPSGANSHTDESPVFGVTSGKAFFTDNVGIGTMTPAFKLDVQGGKLNASDGLCIAGLCKTSWSDVGGSQWSGTGNITYNTGNVGIGTNTPNTARLVIGGTAGADGLDLSTSDQYANMRVIRNSNSSLDNDLFLQFGAGVGSKIHLYSNNSESMTLSGGNIGVGIASPTEKLSVNGTIHINRAGAPGAAEFRLYNGGSVAEWAFRQASGASHDLNISKAVSGVYSDFLTINTAGNVGVGTASPGAKLSVNTANANDGIMLNGSTNWAMFGSNFGTGSYNNLTKAGDRGIVYGGASAGNPGGGFVIVPWVSATSGIRLDPSGNLSVGGDLNTTGAITGATINATYQDVAEWVPSTQKLQAGTVVVLHANLNNHVLASSHSYDTRVAGVVSSQPGLILGQGGDDKLKVATTGRVKVRVDATRAPIHVGDLLVTSDVEGVAMKSEPVMIQGRTFHSPGTIIGKALEPLEKGTGEILVLLSLQ